MDWGSPSFVLAIIAISYGAWIINNWIRAKHGYALEDEWGGKTDHQGARSANSQEVKQLRDEKQALNDQIDKMTDRLIVLEKIVTDRGYDVATQIEALRDQRLADHKDSGIPLETKNRERI
jgi:cell division protein FtsB